MSCLGFRRGVPAGDTSGARGALGMEAGAAGAGCTAFGDDETGSLGGRSVSTIVLMRIHELMCVRQSLCGRWKCVAEKLLIFCWKCADAAIGGLMDAK